MKIKKQSKLKKAIITLLLTLSIIIITLPSLATGPGLDANKSPTFIHPSTDLTTDTDGDRLQDYLETYIYMTDKFNPDTDSDGYSDGDEVLIWKTDPLDPNSKPSGLNSGYDDDGDGLSKFYEDLMGYNDNKIDSNGNGISDANEDYDGDGLSNILEINQYKTNPISYDTDNDSYSDGEEINGVGAQLYKTDPLKADTDEDYINDYEEIQLGLNPLLAKSNGILLDNERTFDRTLTVTSPILTSVNANSPYKVSVSGKFAGNVENLFVSNNIQSLSNAVYGEAITFNYPDFLKSENFAITFDLTSSALTRSTPPIANDYRIFKYTEEYGIFLPIYTTVNGQSNTLSVQSSYGTYCVVNIAKLARSLEPKYENSVFTVDESKIITLLEHKYAFITNADVGIDITYDKAKSLCEEMGGHLITVNNAMEQALLYNNLTQNSLIGLRSNDNVTREWITGEPMTYSSFITSYGMSDITADNNVYAAINTGISGVCSKGDWYTVSSTTAMPIGFVCEWDTHKVFSGHMLQGGDIKLPMTKAVLDNFDSDHDGLTDWTEIDVDNAMLSLNSNKTEILSLPTYKEVIQANDDLNIRNAFSGITNTDINTLLDLPTLLYKSNPFSEDSDDDGLLDGRPVIVDGKKVAPIDPKPLKYTAPKGVWKQQIFTEKQYAIATEYDESGWLGDGLANFGQLGLNLKRDNKNQALHSQVVTWQKIGGYNDLYDEAFRTFTGDQMYKEKFDFKNEPLDNATPIADYIVWTWRGDYLNLRSGAEIGIYESPVETGIIGQHWQSSSVNYPMTLNLYDITHKNNIINVFNWAPTQSQWWITGFNPIHPYPGKDNLVSIGSIDLAGYEDMFRGLKKKVESEDKLKNYMIFDEDGHTVWLNWYTL